MQADTVMITSGVKYGCILDEFLDLGLGKCCNGQIWGMNQALAVIFIGHLFCVFEIAFNKPPHLNKYITRQYPF